MQTIPKSLKKAIYTTENAKNEGFGISSNKKAKINNITPRQQRRFCLNCQPLLTGYAKRIPVVLLFFRNTVDIAQFINVIVLLLQQTITLLQEFQNCLIY